MRRILLSVSLFVLLAVTGAMWNLRFERVRGAADWHLADLRMALPPTDGVTWTGAADDPVLRLILERGNPPLAIRLALPGVVPMDGLHLRFRISSRRLVPGPEKWQDGRVMLEWEATDGQHNVRRDSVGSITGDRWGEVENLVILSPAGSWVPTLRLEHLGQSGSFELSKLEITAVEETPVWKLGRWMLAITWLAWAAAWVRSWPGVSWRRATAAAAIWVVLGVNFVIPGPWNVQRSLVSDFCLDAASGGVMARTPLSIAPETAAPSRSLAPGVTTALGKMPDQGSLVLRLKHAISRARPLLHATLLFAPTLAFLWLVGRDPALFLSIAFAISIEMAQLAFGYGFDWQDVGDLATDGIGIVLAIYLHKVFQPFWGRLRLAALTPERSARGAPKA